MAGLILSEAEKVFVIHGIEEGYRSDGRSLLDYRPMELETDIVPHTSGSARLRLANTDILVGVKTEIDVPFPDKPELGKLEFFVDCSANATPQFEGRGGEQLGTQISSCLLRAYSSPQAFNLKQLCILPQKQCWKLYIDILVLECGGNLYDAVSLAVKGALMNTKIPCVKAAVMDGGNVDLVLSDDPFDSKTLDVGSAPLLVTIVRIGKALIVDPTLEEEKCSDALLVVGVSGDSSNYLTNKPITGEDIEMKDSSVKTNIGKYTTIMTIGTGSFHIKNFCNGLKQGRTAALELDKALGAALLEEQKVVGTTKRIIYGFLK